MVEGIRMNFEKDFDGLPFVVGNVFDENNYIREAFAMLLEEIPNFIQAYQMKKRLLIISPLSKMPILEVNDMGDITCGNPYYLNELQATLQSTAEKRVFKPLC